MSELIAFTDEQSMLLETANEFCRNQSSIDLVRSKLDAESVDTATWKDITELGWLGVNIPEQFGGLDMGLASTAPIVEAMGRHLMGLPYVSSVIAAEVLSSSGSEEQKGKYLPKIVAGSVVGLALVEEDGSWHLDEMMATGVSEGDLIKLSGQKVFVTDADVAEFFLVSVNVDGVPSLGILHAEQLGADAIRRETVIDQTRRSFQVVLDGASMTADQLLPSADFRRLELASLLLLSAEATGGISGVLPVMVDYLNTRKAFGRAIGSYQSLKHPTVEVLLGVEGSRSHLYAAATAYANDDNAEAAIRMAKAHASDAFAFAGDRAVQFHGGFGFTFECDAQLFLRRALWCQYQFGDAAFHRQLLAPLLLDEAI